MDIAANVERIHSHIEELCQRYGRSSNNVRLIAVTKTRDCDVLQSLAAAGIRDLGENRLEHLEQMQQGALARDLEDFSWHGIGRVQSRQLPQWVTRCDCLHSLHSIRHVEKLAKACREARDGAGKKLPVFIQVNTSGEDAKAGLDAEDLPAMLDALSPHLLDVEPIGLMCMAPLRAADGSNDSLIRAAFERLRTLAHRHSLPRLSMGMSGDYDLAIAAGATDIRLGTVLFQ